MWGPVISVGIVAVLFAAGAWRGVWWRKKHKNDAAPNTSVPTVVGVSAFTGELIAACQPNPTLGDGAPPDECGTP